MPVPSFGLFRCRVGNAVAILVCDELPAFGVTGVDPRTGELGMLGTYPTRAGAEECAASLPLILAPEVVALNPVEM